jgi:hypothetical protein
VTTDGASQGWACYDPATGVWLMNAVPPAQAQVSPAPLPQQPGVIYQQAPPTVIYQQPPAIVYAPRPAYPPSVVLGGAVIDAVGRIASAAIIGSHHPEPYRYTRVEPNRYVRVEPNHYAHAAPSRYGRGGSHERHS